LFESLATESALQTYELSPAMSVRDSLRALRARGAQIDAQTFAWSRDSDPLTPSGTTAESLVTLTPRQLGCTEHPLDKELMHIDRLHAWSRENLPAGRVLVPLSPTDWLSWLAACEELPPIVTCMGVANTAAPFSRLQSVRLAGEEWLYSVPL